jgi:hypothetical protein
MKYTIKYSKVLLLLCLMLSLAACKKDKFLNVNNNPNYPSNVPVNLLLPTCEANIGYMVGNTLGIYGGLWAQFWTQDPTYGSQYGSFDSYLNVPSDNDNVWQALYTTATNLNLIIANADTTQKNYVAIAYMMKAYDFQLLTDGWGDVPVAQALKGTANTSPVYDPGQQVYDSIASWIYTGIQHIDPLRPTSPAEDLIYPGQPMTQWLKFGNTLLMKVYLRECLKNPSRATAGFQKLNALMAANGSGFLTIPSTPSTSATSPGSVTAAGDDALFQYIAVTFQQFPLYATQVYLQVQNLTASATAIGYMQSTNDPRIADFYQIDANGSYGGEPQGDYKALSGQPDVNFSPISTEIISPTASSRLLTASESYFLQAEAAVRGYLPGSASSLYSAGVTASFQSWPHSRIAGASAFLSQGAVSFGAASGSAGQLNLILTQKWISMCGNQNFEAWTEWRRTAYPTFFTLSASSQIPSGKFPLRLVYPSAEINDNLHFPGSQAIYTPVWWDINP